VSKSSETVARAKRRKSLRGVKSPKALGKIKSPVRRPSLTHGKGPEALAMVQAKFLTTLAKTGNVGASCRAAGVARSQAYIWRCEGEREYTESQLAQAEEFKKLWAEALEDAVDLLEKEAVRRGRDGYNKPIVYKGKVVGTYKEYSDRLLEILLKAHRRSKFGDRTELTGADGGPISTVRKVERVIVDPQEKKQ